MALVDSIATLVSKATDFKTRLFNFNVLTPPEETTYKDRLFKGTGSGKPALKHKFYVQISNDVELTHLGLDLRARDIVDNTQDPLGSAQSNARVTDMSTRMYPMYSVMSVADNNNEFTFNVDLKTGYTVVAELPKIEKVTITYWDFDDFPHTKFLTNKYLNQLNTDGLLKLGYNSSTVVITDQLREMVYTNVAITKPKSSGFDASLGMRTFTFDFAFSDMTINASSDDKFEALMREAPF